MSPTTASSTGNRLPAHGVPLTREELVIATRLAEHLASQLAELDRREVQLKSQLARLVDAEREVLSVQNSLRQREKNLPERESLYAELVECREKLAIQDRSIASLEEELVQTRAEFESLQKQFQQDKSTLEEQLAELIARHARAQEANTALLKRKDTDFSSREAELKLRLEEASTLRDSGQQELEAARLKIVEERVAFEAECARLRKRIEDERLEREAALDQEAARLAELRRRNQEISHSLELQQQNLASDREAWQASADERRQTLETELNQLKEELESQQQKQALQALEQEREQLQQERQQVLDEIEKRKQAATEWLTAEKTRLEQVRAELDQQRQELTQDQAQHQKLSAEWMQATRSKTEQVVAGIDEIRREKLAGLDLREAELNRREIDFKKRVQFHERHLDRVRSELKEKQTQLEKQRQTQRVWIEQVETSIRLRMSHLKRFRDLVAGREQSLDDERRHLLEMQQSAASQEAKQVATLERMQLDLAAYGEQLKDWFSHPQKSSADSEAAAASLAAVLESFSVRSGELQDLISSVQGQRESWQAEREEAERVIRQLVLQLENALDELAAQQATAVGRATETQQAA